MVKRTDLIIFVKIFFFNKINKNKNGNQKKKRTLFCYIHAVKLVSTSIPEGVKLQQQITNGTDKKDDEINL